MVLCYTHKHPFKRKGEAKESREVVVVTHDEKCGR